MEPSIPAQSPNNLDVKPSFRKHGTDAANRKYRRHSPAGGSGSSSSGGSPKHRSRSPVRSDDRRRKDDRRELERDSDRNHSIRNDSHRYSHRLAVEEDRGYHRSSRGGRESRSGTNSDYMKHGGNSDRSREIWRSGDKYSRDNKPEITGHRSKDKDYWRNDRDTDRTRDHRRSPDDYKNDRSRTSREESGVLIKGSSVGRDSGSMRSKDTLFSGSSENNVHRVKRKHEERENDRRKEKYPSDRESDKHKDKADMRKEKTDSVKDYLEPVTSLKNLIRYDSEDEKPSASSKQVKPVAEKFTSEQVSSVVSQSETAQDLNAAKFAAMKAAELVNKNLVGNSCLTTDQKKKLLWGNKKNTSTVESSNRWDQQLFADRERQEKFNKLMGVKSDAIPEHKPSEMDAEKKQQLEMDLEKQYTAGLRRRDGRTVGLGL